MVVIEQRDNRLNGVYKKLLAGSKLICMKEVSHEWALMNKQKPEDVTIGEFALGDHSKIIEASKNTRGIAGNGASGNCIGGAVKPGGAAKQEV